MDGSWIRYDKLVVWCNFSIPWLDSSPHPPILGEMGKLPHILPKFDVALIRQRVVTKRCNLRKLENIISRGISPTVWWKICKSSFPNFGGSMAMHCTGFSSERRYQVGGLLLEQHTPWVELGDFQAKPKCRGRHWKAHLTMALSFCEVLGGLRRQGTALSLTGPEVLGSR